MRNVLVRNGNVLVVSLSHPFCLIDEVIMMQINQILAGMVTTI